MKSFYPISRWCTLLTGLLIFSAAASRAQVTTLIVDKFDTNGALNGAIPTITLPGATWVAKTGTSVSGGLVSLNGAQTDSLNLGSGYFTANPGVYTLSLDVTLPTGAGTTSNHYGVGFVVNPVTNGSLFSTGIAAGLNPNGGTNGGTPVIDLRHDGAAFVYDTPGHMIYLTGPGVYAQGVKHNLKLVLDTTLPAWRLDAFIDAVQLDLNGGATGSTFTYTTNPSGIRYVAITAAGAITGTCDNFRFSKSPSVLPADSLVDSIGLNVSGWTFRGATSSSTIASKLTAAGVRHVRDFLAIDQPAGTTCWQLLQANNIKMCFTLTPGWGGNPAMKTYLINKGLVSSTELLEGPNEPNGPSGWGASTASFCTDIFNVFRGDPATAGIPLVAPGLAIRLTDMTPDHTALGNIGSKVDFGNAHPYPGGSLPLTNLPNEQVLEEINVGNKPMIVTETGYHNKLNTTSGHNPCSELGTSLYLPRLYLEYLAAGVRRTYIFQLLDNMTDAEAAAKGLADSEPHFGLVRNDAGFGEKPAYAALKNLTTIMADPGAPFTPTPLRCTVTGSSDVKSLLFQKRNGKYQLAVWRNVSVWNNSTRVDVVPPTANIVVTFPSSRALVQVYFPTTSATVATSSANAASVTVPLQGQVAILQF